METQRKHYCAKEKVALLRRHLIDGVEVSALCEESGVQPTVFYRWQKTFFEQGAAAFERENGREHRDDRRRIEQLEEKLRRKDEVLSELMEEHVHLKKSLGEI